MAIAPNESERYSRCDVGAGKKEVTDTMYTIDTSNPVDAKSEFTIKEKSNSVRVRLSYQSYPSYHSTRKRAQTLSPAHGDSNA